MTTFSFHPHKPADDEAHFYGMVHVRIRETGETVGMLNPIDGGGYVLRDTKGVRLGSSYGFDDVVYLSRPVCASILRQRVAQIAETKARRADSVTAGCPNNWHNGGKYRETKACPDCPSGIGLSVAIAEIRTRAEVMEFGGDDGSSLRALADDLSALLYRPEYCDCGCHAYTLCVCRVECAKPLHRS